MTFKGIIGFSVLSLFSVSVLADMPSVNPRPRTLMMGGAGLSTTGDKTSASLNPAGLSDIEEWEVQALPILVQFPFELDSMTSFLDYNDVRDDDSKTEDEKAVALEEFLTDVGSEAISARINFYPSFTMKYFHVGLLVEAVGNPTLRVNNITGNSVMDVQGTNMTYGGVIAGSYSFFEDSLSVGMTLKPMYRYATFTNESITLYDVMLGKNPSDKVSERLIGDNIFDRGAFAFGVDLGARYRFEWYGNPESEIKRWMDILKPAVGLTYQDVGNTRFVGRDGDVPKDIDQSVSLGLSLEPEIWLLKTAFALDFRNLQEEQAFFNKLHLGAEATIWDILSARVGLAQGYFTGGMGVDVPFFELDAFVTSEEVGEAANVQDATSVGVRISFTI